MRRLATCLCRLRRLPLLIWGLMDFGICWRLGLVGLGMELAKKERNANNETWPKSEKGRRCEVSNLPPLNLPPFSLD